MSNTFPAFDGGRPADVPNAYPRPGDAGTYGAEPSGPGPYSPGPYGGGHGAYDGYPAPARTNAMALASLICSLAGFLTGVTALVGIVLGHIALGQIRRTGEQGRGLAIAGLAVGYGLVALGVLVIAFAVAIFGAAVAGSGGYGY